MSFLYQILKRKDSVTAITLILLITKIAGFIKIRIFADLFGTSLGDLDLFWAAFLVPDTLFNILIAGSINAAVIPTFSDILHKKGEESVVRFLGNTTVFIFLVALLFMGMLFITAPAVSEFLVSGHYIGGSKQFSPEDIDLLVKLMRIMLLSPILLAVSSIITAFLQVHSRFFITTTAALFYNVGIIIGSLILVGRLGYGIEGLAWAVVAGSALHLLTQIPILIEFIRRNLHLYKVVLLGTERAFYLGELARMVKLSIPRILAYAGEQFNMAVNTLISLTLSEGALSAYKFALSLHLFPIQIFASAIAQVSLPRFTQHYIGGQLDDFKRLFDKTFRQTMFVILPSVVIMVVLRLPLARLTYGLEEWRFTVITSWCLAFLGISVIGQSGILISLRALYAISETRLPLISTVVSIVVNIVLSYYFTNFFSHYYDWRPIVNQIFLQVTDAVTNDGTTLTYTLGTFVSDLNRWFTVRNVSDAAVGGLPFALGIALMVEMVLNLYFLHIKTKIIDWKGTLKPIWIMLQNSALMFIAMYAVYRLSDLSLDTTRTIYVIIVVFVASGVGGGIYLLLSVLRGVQELDIITAFFSTINGRLKAIWNR